MASTYCNLTQRCGLNKLNGLLHTQASFRRNYMGFKRSTCKGQGVFHRRCRRLLVVKRVLCNAGADVSFSSFEEEQGGEEIEEHIPKGILIWRAIKLPMYSVAWVPLTVGSAEAYLQTGLFSA